MARTSEPTPQAEDELPPHPEEHADAPLNPIPTEPSPLAAAAEIEPASGIPDFQITPDYSEVFGSDFRPGTGLITDKWWTRYIFENGMLDYLNDEWQRYREDGNHVRNARGLSLTSLPHNGHFWPSGLIRSKPTFPITDGNDWYFEARAKCPRGKGVWPAVWLAADQRPEDLGNWERMPGWPPEIDIMEVVNNGTDDTLQMLHTNAHVRQWPSNPQQVKFVAAREGFNRDWNYLWVPFSFADDYHLFSIHYKRPLLTWYLDRQFVFRLEYQWVNDDRRDSGPAHLILNLAIGGNWAGRYGIDTAAFPQSFDVDYVRVYKKNGKLPMSVIGHDLLKESDTGQPPPPPPPPTGPSNDDLRNAMQASLDQLAKLMPLSPSNQLDPHLVHALTVAYDTLNAGLKT